MNHSNINFLIEQYGELKDTVLFNEKQMGWGRSRPRNSV